MGYNLVRKKKKAATCFKSASRITNIDVINEI